MELLQSLDSLPCILSLIQLLSPVRDIDIVLDQNDTLNFAQKIDNYLHDVPFVPFYKPQVHVRFDSVSNGAVEQLELGSNGVSLQ